MILPFVTEFNALINEIACLSLIKSFYLGIFLYHELETVYSLIFCYYLSFWSRYIPTTYTDKKVNGR